MEELGEDHIVCKLMRGALEFEPDTFNKAIEAIRNTSAFERSYADARHQAIDALEYLKPFKKNTYYKALEEIALYTVDRGF
jgi:heptaprenyl diphosphate synthase